MNSGADTENALAVRWCGEALDLYPDGSAFHAAGGTLFVADVHVGKPAYFRARGRPVPEEVTRYDLDRLTERLRATGAERLVVLGDLLHAPVARNGGTANALREWRDSNGSIGVFLVLGNHDRWSRRTFAEAGVEILPAGGTDGPFALRHEPIAEGASAPVLAGHLHPSVRIRSRGSSWMRCSCFWFGASTGVLPAFGRFTGTSRVRPRSGDIVAATGSGRVIDVSRMFAARRV